VRHRLATSARWNCCWKIAGRVRAGAV